MQIACFSALRRRRFDRVLQRRRSQIDKPQSPVQSLGAPDAVVGRRSLIEHQAAAPGHGAGKLLGALEQRRMPAKAAPAQDDALICSRPEFGKQLLHFIPLRPAGAQTRRRRGGSISSKRAKRAAHAALLHKIYQFFDHAFRSSLPRSFPESMVAFCLGLYRERMIWPSMAAFTLLALLSALYFTRVRDYRTASRYSYELSFEQTAAAVSALSDTLEKSRYATGELCHALASEAFAEACAAKAALATLPFSTVEMEQTKGFLGTVGDFTHGLCARSGEFTDDERADVLALSDTAAAYSALLLDLREKAANGELEMDSREKRLENVLPSPAVRHLSDGFREAEENFPVLQELKSVASDAAVSLPQYLDTARARRAAAAFLGISEELLGEEYGYADGSAAFSRGTLTLRADEEHVLTVSDSRLVGESSVSDKRAAAKAREILLSAGYDNMAETSRRKSGNVLYVSFTGKNELTQRASAEQNAAPSDEDHAEEVEHAVRVCDRLIRESEFEVLRDQVADHDCDDDRDKAVDQMEVLEHDRITDTACHAKTRALTKRADDDRNQNRRDPGRMLTAGTFFALCKQRRDERQDKEDDQHDGKNQTLRLVLLVCAVEREAEAKRERADDDADDEAEQTDHSVKIAAADADHHAERASEEHKTADHDKHADEESGDRRRTALRTPFFFDHCHQHRADHDADDLRTEVLYDAGSMEFERASDIAFKAGDAESHVLRVAQRTQYDCSSTDCKTGQNHEPMPFQKAREPLLIVLHFVTSFSLFPCANNALVI